MKDTEIPQLGLFNNFTSKRLFFAKTSFGDPIWHICDFALSRALTSGGRMIGRETMALHGRYIKCAVEVDTVDQMTTSVSRQTDHLCQGCLDAFAVASDVIKAKGLLKFSTERLEVKDDE